ncbi:MAG: cephalosporin hydroxylase [Acidimicrobiales bacterium]|nr:cephalosporin hydroxylase [Acidimicrobiales bacterium]
MPSDALKKTIIEQFQRLYYYSSQQTWRETYYRGCHVYKSPTDLWIYQEIVNEVGPSLIIESGTNRGGSAYFLADLCETIGKGKVVTIDVEEFPDRPIHDRIKYLVGRSVDSEVIREVEKLLPLDGGPVMVILDSDHSAENVAAELEVYSNIVTPNSYLIVEDTNICGNPVMPNLVSGPMEAVAAFLSVTSDFVIDKSREKFMLTFNPSGYLRKCSLS